MGDEPLQDVSWPVNEIRIQAHLHPDGQWTIRSSGLVNGEYRSELSTVPAGHLAAGIGAAVARFEQVYRGELL